MNPGKKVGERILQRETNRETANSQGGERRRDRHAEGLRDDEDAERDDREPRRRPPGNIRY